MGIIVRDGLAAQVTAFERWSYDQKLWIAMS
jgi:hypothetical protein